MRMNKMNRTMVWNDTGRDSTPPLGAEPQGDRECIARYKRKDPGQTWNDNLESPAAVMDDIGEINP